MKSVASIVTIMIASLLLWACGNNTPKRIVSEVPIKTEVLGLKLGDVSSEKAVEKALAKATGKYVLNGEDRSFCTLYYVSRDLYNALEEANIPDV